MRVQATPGDVLADPLDVVVLAGREPLFDPFVLPILSGPGGWDSQLLVDRICSGEVRLVVVAEPIEAMNWPARLQSAVASTMMLEGVTASRSIYVPMSVPPPSCPAEQR